MISTMRGYKRGKRLRAASSGFHAGQSRHELAFGDVLDHHLVRHMYDGAGAGISLVTAFDIAIQNNIFPGHEHVIEDDYGIHFFKA
jgi:hypothetical protein